MIRLALAVAVGIIGLSFVGGEHPTITLMKALIVLIPVAGIGYGSYLVKRKRETPATPRTATQRVYKNGIKRAYLVQEGSRFEASCTGSSERREKRAFRSQQAAERWISSKLK